MKKGIADGRRHYCESHTDVRHGTLTSEQSTEWIGPPLSDRDISLLPSRMDREHFSVVERSTLTLVHYRMSLDSVNCSLLGVVPLLRFGAPKTEVASTGATRTWLITGGVLARSDPSLGSITFAWTMRELTDGQWLHRLSACVEGYPSRFISRSSVAWLGPALRAVAGAYAWYHGVVTCRFLRRLSRGLRQESGEARN
jgi:hypothetical protein